MENRNILRQLFFYLVIAIIAAMTRLIPHPANFTVIGALALFSGAYLPKKVHFFIPLTAMLLSDLIIGFHSAMPYVYASFILIGLMGVYLKKNRSFGTLFTITLSSSLLFFFITNFGVWATGTMYAKNVYGLLQSYVMGLPFLRNTMLGDLFYTFAFFYGYQYSEIILRKFSFKKISN